MRILRMAEIIAGGAAVMILEIVGTRLLAPRYGASLVVWAAQISVTLAALASGYVLGGYLGDRRPDGSSLHPVLFVSGLLTGLGVLVSGPLMAAALGWGLAPGAFLSSALLFGPALVLLGSLGPQAVRWSRPGLAPGRNVGEVLALSTLGSLAATLLAAFVLVPALGVRASLLGTAALLSLLGALGTWGLRRGGMLGLVVAGTLGAVQAQGHRASGKLALLMEKSSFHGDLRVVEAVGMRMLLMDGIIQSGQDQKNGLSAFPYTHVLDQIASMHAPKAKKAVVVGLGAGLLPRALAARGVETQVFELDPEVLRVCRAWFGFPDSIPVALGDGRVLLSGLQEAQDLIVLDVYSGDVSPFQLMTREAFTLARSKLSDQGVLLVNLLGTLDGPSARVPLALAATLAGVFPKVWVYGGEEAGPGHYANLLFAAGPDQRPQAPAALPADLDSRLAAEVKTTVSGGREAPRGTRILTDDYNPVDLWDRSMRARWRMDTVRYLGLG